ncbi:MAG: glutamine--fructose-6-phosphate transaminase (isomerizing) [Candidatus Micrarchaeia archaeon]
MCGIIGYVGPRKASEVVFSGLRKLEYRGYDSAGIATMAEKGIKLIKDVGRIDDIHAQKDFLQLEGTIGIGHTRWATHGGVTAQNAHPHTDCTGKIYLVHNGVIENFTQLRGELIEKKHKLKSETDTELIAHLVEEALKSSKSTEEAFEKAVSRLKGSWSLVMMRDGERAIHLSRNGPPLVLGIGNKEMFCASDIPALLEYTKQVVFVEDGDRVRFDESGFAVYRNGKKIQPKVHAIEWDAQMAQKDGYEHFMLKEIFEQQSRIRDSIGCDVAPAKKALSGSKRMAVIACGTSYYAGLVFRQMLAGLGLDCSVYIGSEFQYQRTGREDAVVAISQSGETADTLSAVRLAKAGGAKVIAVTNVVGSSLYREAGANVIIGAGPELAVVATKSFTCQIGALAKLAYAISGNEKKAQELAALSEKIESVLNRSKEIESLADSLLQHRDFFFIGRSYSFPTALEGALKLKEITYLHAEAYAAGELKHGPLSLLDKDVVVIAIAPSDGTMHKTMSNIQECKARGAKIIVFSDSEEAGGLSRHHFLMPAASGVEIPILYAVPFQLLAYYLAVKMKKDPDKPRNLAKSVTVE